MIDSFHDTPQEPIADSSTILATMKLVKEDPTAQATWFVAGYFETPSKQPSSVNFTMAGITTQTYAYCTLEGPFPFPSFLLLERVLLIVILIQAYYLSACSEYPAGSNYVSFTDLSVKIEGDIPVPSPSWEPMKRKSCFCSEKTVILDPTHVNITFRNTSPFF